MLSEGGLSQFVPHMEKGGDMDYLIGRVGEVLIASKVTDDSELLE